jgi:hypothetical protein
MQVTDDVKFELQARYLLYASVLPDIVLLKIVFINIVFVNISAGGATCSLTSEAYLALRNRDPVDKGGECRRGMLWRRRAGWQYMKSSSQRYNRPFFTLSASTFGVRCKQPGISPFLTCYQFDYLE